MNFNQAFSCS